MKKSGNKNAANQCGTLCRYAHIIILARDLKTNVGFVNHMTQFAAIGMNVEIMFCGTGFHVEIGSVYFIHWNCVISESQNNISETVRIYLHFYEVLKEQTPFTRTNSKQI